MQMRQSFQAHKCRPPDLANRVLGKNPPLSIEITWPLGASFFNGSRDHRASCLVRELRAAVLELGDREDRRLGIGCVIVADRFCWPLRRASNRAAHSPIARIANRAIGVLGIEHINLVGEIRAVLLFP